MFCVVTFKIYKKKIKHIINNTFQFTIYSKLCDGITGKYFESIKVYRLNSSIQNVMFMIDQTNLIHRIIIQFSIYVNL